MGFGVFFRFWVILLLAISCCWGGWKLLVGLGFWDYFSVYNRRVIGHFVLLERFVSHGLSSESDYFFGVGLLTRGL